MNGLKLSSRLALAAALAAGFLGASAVSASAAGATVAFLMPDEGSTRYEEHDRPGFVAEMKKLCADCTELYQNADTDATKQQQQFNSVITQGAKGTVIDPDNCAAAASLVALAHAQGVKVISRDRPIPTGTADYYSRSNNDKCSKAIARRLIAHLCRAKADPA